MKNQKTQLAASLICANFSNLDQEIDVINKAKMDWIHFDVMDGVFVPRFGLYPEILQIIKPKTSVPVDVHLMIQDPQNYISAFAKAGADMITVHVEACTHLHRTIQLIKAEGIKAGVVLNPATSLSTLDYILDDVDCVVLMAINPGILGHKLIPGMLSKIADLHSKLQSHPNVVIEIDGGVSFDSGPLMRKAGANILVCGTSSIYNQSTSLDKRVTEFRRILNT